jgi:hypothetical protein
MSFPPCFPTKLQNQKVKNACSMKIRVQRIVLSSFQRDSTSLNDYKMFSFISSIVPNLRSVKTTQIIFNFIILTVKIGFTTLKLKN